MATVKAVSSKAGIGQAIDYVSKKEKTEAKLMSGIGCQPETAKEEMALTKEIWGKTDGRTYKHFTQNFHKDENITHEQAHEIAVKLASDIPAWKGHEVLIATHKDREHIHTHFIINSVNTKDGKKLQWSKQDLESMKQKSDALCLQYGLTVCEKGKTFEGASRTEPSTYTKEAYQSINNALKNDSGGDLGHSGDKKDVRTESYVTNIKNAVLDAKSKAKSRHEFGELLLAKGIKVNWTDSRKYITFTDIAREEAGEKKCKVRHTNLEKTFNMDFSGESLKQAFFENLKASAEKTAMLQQQPEQAFDDPNKLESKSVPVVAESIAPSAEPPRLPDGVFKGETPAEKQICKIEIAENEYNGLVSTLDFLQRQRNACKFHEFKAKKELDTEISDYQDKISAKRDQFEKLEVEYSWGTGRWKVAEKIAELEAKIPQERAELARERATAKKKDLATSMSDTKERIRKEKQDNPIEREKSQERNQDFFHDR